MNKITCPFCSASIEDDSIFCDHCGKALHDEPQRIVLQCPNESLTLTLNDGAVIGRRSMDTLALGRYGMVSGTHAKVYRLDDRWVIADQGSSNGTWVNGERVQQGAPCTIKRGSVVKIASLQFVVG